MKISKQLREYFQDPSMALERLILEVEALEESSDKQSNEVAFLQQIVEVHEKHIAELEKQLKQERDISVLYPPPVTE